MRFCIDLTKLNTSTKREFYQHESVDETLVKIGKSCSVMTNLDANSGYWQIPLAEDSRLKATFITPFGRFCPTRGPFGLTSMQEIFHKRLDKIVDGLTGVVKNVECTSIQVYQEGMSQPTLAHYCVTKPTKIRTDGSKLNGISVILF